VVAGRTTCFERPFGKTNEARMISKPENPSVQSVWQGFDRKAFPAGATIFAEGETGTGAPSSSFAATSRARP
jgi:hypothetical protein